MENKSDNQKEKDKTNQNEKKYLLKIQYNGANYSGWQLQNERKTIQGVIEEKLKILLKEDVRLFVAGRTDAKVHANGQCAHICVSENNAYKLEDPFKFLYSLNALLRAETIVILSINEIEDPQFHARFSCKSKTYKYYIFKSYIKDIFLEKTTWRVPQFDIAKANECAQYIIGQHDFSSIRDTQCQSKSPIRSIDKCIFYSIPHQFGELICMEVSGRSFLHHQIRILVGTIHQIVATNKPAITMQDILEKKDRSVAGPTAPAQGLFLETIEY